MLFRSGTGVRSSRHMPPCLTAQRNPSTPFLRRKDKSPGQPDPRKPTPSGLGFQTCALSSGPCPGALLCNFFEGVFRPWSNFFDWLFGTKQKKSSLEFPKLLLLTRFQYFFSPGARSANCWSQQSVCPAWAFPLPGIPYFFFQS